MPETTASAAPDLSAVFDLVQPNTAFATNSAAAFLCFLAVDDLAAFRALLGHLDGNGHLDAAGADARDAACQVAFTTRGLRRLGLPESLLKPLGQAFGEGMGRRADLLRDSGPHAPQSWQWPYGTADVDALLVIWLKGANGDPTVVFPDAPSDLAAALSAAGCRALATEGAQRRVENGTVVNPFGFADGVSQPSTPEDPETGDELPEAALLKRLAAYFLSIDPTAKAGSAGEPWCEAVREAESRAGGERRVIVELADAMRAGGTFLVYRKIATDQAKFDAWCQETASAPGQDLDAEEVAQRVFGRERDGTPLVPDSATPKTANDFDFADDTAGAACPFGAHARRANPRAGVDPETSSTLQRPIGGKEWPKNKKRIFGRHSMIRRGIGFAEGAGLHFLAVVRDIEAQFEFIQREWMNNGSFIGQPSRNVDVIASTRGTETDFEIGPDGQTVPAPVVTRLQGGEYFFLPGRGFIRLLANGKPDPSIARAGEPQSAPPAQRAPLGDPLARFRPAGEAILGGLPVIKRDGTVIVARYADVKAVLEDVATYSSGHYLRRIRELTHGQDFVLGMPAAPDPSGRPTAHAEQRDRIDDILAPDVMDQVWPPAEDPLTGVDRPEGVPTDLLFDIVWRRLARLAALQFGVQVPDTVGPSAAADFFGDVEPFRYLEVYRAGLWQQLYPWTESADRQAHNLQSVVRNIGAYIIGVSEGDFTYERAAGSAGEFLKLWAQAAGHAYTGVQLGLTVASGGTIAKAAAHVFWRLMTDPTALRAALAAMAGTGAGPDALQPVILEALRLNPVLPIIRRDASRDTHLHGTAVPATTTVLALIEYALRDPAQFARPDVFDTSHSFSGELVFGAGAHRCSGESVALAFLCRAVHAVLSRYHIRRVAGERDGPIYANPLSTDPVSLFAHLEPRP